MYDKLRFALNLSRQGHLQFEIQMINVTLGYAPTNL